MPKKAPEWLNAEIQECYPGCHGNIREIQRAILEKRGVDIAYMTISDRLKRLGLARPRDQRKAAPEEGSMSIEEAPVEVLPGQMGIDDDGVSAVADIATVTTEVLAPMSSAELETLAHYEQIIAQGIKTFVQVGHALLAIRDQQLYRASYQTFEDYLRERWDLSRPYAYQLMDASQVVDTVSAIADIIPTNEAQARPLTSLPPEQQQEVWREVIETAPQGRVTAKHVKATVERRKTGVNGTTPTTPKRFDAEETEKHIRQSFMEWLRHCEDARALRRVDDFLATLHALIDARGQQLLPG